MSYSAIIALFIVVCIIMILIINYKTLKEKFSILKKSNKQDNPKELSNLEKQEARSVDDLINELNSPATREGFSTKPDDETISRINAEKICTQFFDAKNYDLAPYERERYVRYVQNFGFDPYLESIEKFEQKLFARNKKSMIPAHFHDENFLNHQNNADAVFNKSKYGSEYAIQVGMDNQPYAIYKDGDKTYDPRVTIDNPYFRNQINKNISGGDQYMYSHNKYLGLQNKMQIDSLVKANARAVNMGKAMFSSMLNSDYAFGPDKFNDTSRDGDMEKFLNERIMYDVVE